MKIEVTCRDNGKFLRQVEVYDLCFDRQSNTFSMTYCVGAEEFGAWLIEAENKVREGFRTMRG